MGEPGCCDHAFCVGEYLSFCVDYAVPRGYFPWNYGGQRYEREQSCEVRAGRRLSLVYGANVPEPWSWVGHQPVGFYCDGIAPSALVIV